MRQATKQLLLTVLILSINFFAHAQNNSISSTIDNSSMIKTYNQINDIQVQIDEMEKNIENANQLINVLEQSLETNTQDVSEQIIITKKAITREIEKIALRNSTLRQELNTLVGKQNELTQMISIYKKSIRTEIESIKTEHNALVDDIEGLTRKTEGGMITIQRNISTKTLFGGLAILTTLLIIAAVIFFTQRKFKKVSILEKSIMRDTKMSELLEDKLTLLGNKSVEKDVTGTIEEIDHSLPIRVGNEIFRMRKRIANMDESTTGISALKNALTRLEDEFNRQGYTLNDLTGQDYKDELIVKVVNSFEKDDLEPGVRIISRMITPHILRKGVVISHGEVELATSSKNVEKS